MDKKKLMILLNLNTDLLLLLFLFLLNFTRNTQINLNIRLLESVLKGESYSRFDNYIVILLFIIC